MFTRCCLQDVFQEVCKFWFNPSRVTVFRKFCCSFRLASEVRCLGVWTLLASCGEMSGSYSCLVTKRVCTVIQCKYYEVRWLGCLLWLVGTAVDEVPMCSLRWPRARSEVHARANCTVSSCTGGNKPVSSRLTIVAVFNQKLHHAEWSTLHVRQECMVNVSSNVCMGLLVCV